MDYQISNVEVAKASTGSGVGTNLLSQDICVIPKSKNISTDAAITASSALLINDTDNKVIYAQDIYSKQYPASVTKIVTALVALKNASLSDKVTISYNASHVTEYGAKLCGFEEGDVVSMKDLLYCLLIYSGNDAAVAIAEHISGSVEEFATVMNQEMISLGASGSHFVNPNGLHDDDHYTTAYDLYLVFHELLQYKSFRKIIRKQDYTAHWKDANGEKHSLSMTNTNQYLASSVTSPDGITVIGGKTGTTINAGSCLILYSRDEQKKDYISVILKADSSYSLYSQMTYLLGKI
jgi:D-alanyl-D-alanine carboxypeptidase